jgi:hypothetical protein
MIPSRHFDHTVTVWGSHEHRGPTFGDVTRRFSQVPGQDGVRIALQTRKETRLDSGPGERVAGEWRGFGHAAMNVVEGDVIEVTAGPELTVPSDEPLYLKVESAYRPKGRHLQLVLSDYSGELN